jgi:hypothetical protein
MGADEQAHAGAVLIGGRDGTDAPRSIVARRPAAAALLGGAVAGPWPSWARAQLETAVDIADRAPDRLGVATVLYREWFNPLADGPMTLRARPPLAGLYRAAHAGSTRRVTLDDGVSVVLRHDVVRSDGWWRTWGENWTPPRERRGSVRLLFTPRPDRLVDFVAAVTERMLPEAGPWLLACATDPRRIARYGCALLDVPALSSVPAGLLDTVAPMLRPAIPPLSLPLAPGVGAAEYPDNGMTFGEHRCHLVALALRQPRRSGDPLRSIARVFAAHGLDPAHPHRARAAS